MLNIRQKQNLKYKNIDLPNDTSGVIGYHRDCYSTKRKLSENVTSERVDFTINQTPQTRSCDTDNLTSPGERLFNKVCLFCDQVTKKVKGVKQSLSKCEVKKALDFQSFQNAERCCVHVGGGASEGGIFIFSNELLNKCKIALFLREKWSSRFSDFSLPKYKDENEGYHPRCVKTFLNVNEQVSFGIKSPFENNVRMYALVLQDEHMLEKYQVLTFLQKKSGIMPFVVLITNLVLIISSKNHIQWRIMFGTIQENHIQTHLVKFALSYRNQLLRRKLYTS